MKRSMGRSMRVGSRRALTTEEREEVGRPRQETLNVAVSEIEPRTSRSRVCVSRQLPTLMTGLVATRL